MTLKINNFKLTKLYLVFFIILLFVQVLFWTENRSIRATLPIVKDPPSEKTMKAFTLGDDEFFYRLKGAQVQNMGDTFGRFSPLKDYDYGKLYAWFIALEKLNFKSNYLPSMVAYYYSQTQNVPDRRYVVKFLTQHALKDPKNKWWWLYQASYIANYSLKDKDLAIRLARMLQKYAPDNVPLWVKQTASVYLSEKGENCEAIRVINEVLRDIEKDNTKTDEEKEKELNYMNYFLQREASKITEKEFTKCMNKNYN